MQHYNCFPCRLPLAYGIQLRRLHVVPYFDLHHYHYYSGCMEEDTLVQRVVFRDDDGPAVRCSDLEMLLYFEGVLAVLSQLCYPRNPIRCRKLYHQQVENRYRHVEIRPRSFPEADPLYRPSPRQHFQLIDVHYQLLRLM